jgi:putative cell wall-binding protein
VIPSPHRTAITVVAIAVVVVGVAVAPSVHPASATPGFAFTRLAGSDRHDTARVIAENSFPLIALDVIIARSDDFPDALAGNYVAGAGLPILLTQPDTLPPPTRAALQRLRTTHAILLGGNGAIHLSVESELRGMGITTERVAGSDRFETARECAEYYGTGNIGTVNDKTTAIVASGRNFPDALAAGPLSFLVALPLLLTERDALPAPTQSALTTLEIEQVLLLGGPAAVGEPVEQALTGAGLEVVRIAGGDRTETATQLADFMLDSSNTFALGPLTFGFDDAHINLARGDGFPDALAGGPHAGGEAVPIVLSRSATELGAATRAWLFRHSGTLEGGDIFGGPGAVSASVESQATAAGRGTT